MAQPSTQDVQKPFDPTSYITITGAALAQYVDGISPYLDKGLIVVTTDVGVAPQVPDALSNPKWQNYLWIRRSATSIAVYGWNPALATDVTYQQWGNITLVSLPDGVVTNSKIATGAVTNDKIYSMDWSKLTNIPADFINSGTVAGGDLVGTYPNPTLGNNVVDGAVLESDATVDANRAVGTDHIKDGSITAAKLSASLAMSVIPAGAMTEYGGSASPAGWFECDGSAVNRLTYAALFAAIGTNYGTGDGSTTFNIPDMRGQFARGWDHGAGVDAGRALGSSQTDKVIDHKHSPLSGTHFITDSGSGSFGGGGIAAFTDTTTGFINGALGTGTETRPKNISVMYIIKY